MSVDKYISINDIFLDIVAGMSDESYFWWGDLKTEKIQELNKMAKLPLIFMILPSNVGKTGREDTIATHRGLNIDFIIFDRFKKIDNSSQYSIKNERIQKNVNEAVGQLMYNFTYAIERSAHIVDTPSFSYTENLPLGVSLRNNENGKTEPIFDGYYCGFLLSVTCDIKKYKSCRSREQVFKNLDQWESKRAY